jgi:hypothetical protein
LAAAAWNASIVGATVLPSLLIHFGVGQLVLLRVSIFDIANRTLGLTYVVGNAFVALGTDTDRPLHRRIGPDLGFPVGTDLLQIVCEVERGAGAVRAVNNRNRLRRQFCLGVQLGDRGVIPGLDLAEKDPGESRAVDDELTGRNPGEIDHRYDAAHDHGELNKAATLEIGALERRIGRAERDGFVLNLLDAAAGTIDW